MAIEQYPKKMPVRISVPFTWDLQEAERLRRAWAAHFKDVRVGGPALDDPGGDFVPGRFVKEGMVTTSRGCSRRCSFCLVPGREGPIHELPIKEGWNIFDNNLLACSREHIEAVFEMLRHQSKPAKFTGGLDSRLLQPWHVDLLKTIRVECMYVACDSKRAFPALERARDLLADFHRGQKHCYVLVGYNGETLETAENRLIKVFNLGFMPFSMFYLGPETLQRMPPTPQWRRLIRKWTCPARYKAFMKETRGK